MGAPAGLSTKLAHHPSYGLDLIRHATGLPLATTPCSQLEAWLSQQQVQAEPSIDWTCWQLQPPGAIPWPVNGRLCNALVARVGGVGEFLVR